MEKTYSLNNTEVTCVGLDVSKDRLDYTVDAQRCDHVPNTSAGHARLIEKLRAHPTPVRVICEATGGHERALVNALLTSGIEVCVVNPGRVRAFAHAEGLLAKTDKLDARLLKSFGEKVQPRQSRPADPAATELRELLEYRRQITDQLVVLRNRLTLAPPTLASLLKEDIEHLAKKQDRTDRMIREHIDRNPGLKSKEERLRQLKGVGPVLAATLLAYVPELGQIQDKSLSALIGVAPYSRDSGKSQRTRHVRGGRATVRHVLYMAAVTATQHNRILASFYQRLLDNGKPATLALVAVMRKMLGVLNRLLANPQFSLAQ